MSEPAAEQPKVCVETFTGAQIDAPRISTSTAQILVALDSTLPDERRIEIINALNHGLQWLHVARELMPANEPSSVHIVRPPGGIIVPS